MPGATIFDCEGGRPSPDERAFFRDADPWGFILFARHCENQEAVRALCAELRETVGREAPARGQPVDDGVEHHRGGGDDAGLEAAAGAEVAVELHVQREHQHVRHEQLGDDAQDQVIAHRASCAGAAAAR